MTDFPNRNSQFKKWMTKVWTKFENNINGNWHGDGKLRGCIMESVTDSPGENLGTEILGSDCRLGLESQGIPHMCSSLARFMNFAFSKCETKGRGSIHWANYESATDRQGLLDRLEFRCKRMLEIISWSKKSVKKMNYVPFVLAFSRLSGIDCAKSFFGIRPGTRFVELRVGWSCMSLVWHVTS